MQDFVFWNTKNYTATAADSIIRPTTSITTTTTTTITSTKNLALAQLMTMELE